MVDGERLGRFLYVSARTQYQIQDCELPPRAKCALSRLGLVYRTR
jgi:hypothetical protein